MTQRGLFGADDAEDTYAPEAAAQTDPTDGASNTDASGHPDDDGVREVPLRLFVTLDDLFAPTDLGDALRFANFGHEGIRVTVDPEGQWRLLLYNPATGMWRMQGNQDFPPLYDLKLCEANEEAIEIAEEDPTVSNVVRGRLQRHAAALGAGSVAKALRRSARLVDDPRVPINRVDPGFLNRADRCPVIPCQRELIRLSEGTIADAADLKPYFLLDMTPAPTAFVPDAAYREAPGAAMMRRFLRYLGNGDETTLCRRLGWQLCGHHTTIDVIAGDHHALSLLARALQDVLGPSGARVLSTGRDPVRPRHLASAMEQGRLCLWTGADSVKQPPVWELHSLVSDSDTRRQGNVILLVSDWPSDWNALDHRITGKCGWAWRVRGSLLDASIDPDVLLDQDGHECLLAMLVQGGVHGWHHFQATKAENGIGDPSQVAATEYSRACAEELVLAGASKIQRILNQVLQFTGDPDDMTTLDDIDATISGIGEGPFEHHVIGRAIRQMWPAVEREERGRPHGKQVRLIRRVALRSEVEM